MPTDTAESEQANLVTSQDGIEMVRSDKSRSRIFTGTSECGVPHKSVRAVAKQQNFMEDDTWMPIRLTVFSIVLLLLYGFYFGFCVLWIYLLLEYGDLILWVFFGMFIAVFGAM